jgi:UDP-N-acetylglucosamine 2-epimerase (non-hydrolysing)
MMHLWREGVEKRRVFLYGNTVADALRYFLPANVQKSKTLLLTLHRREHSEQALRGIFSAVRALMERFLDHSLLYPVHPSPRVRSVAEQMLGGLSRISLVPPLAPPAFYPLLAAAPLVLTDSGGIQEEAALLGVRTLVLREQTERESELLSGKICLAGTEPNRIFSLASALLSEPQKKRKESLFGSPSARICKLLLSFKECGFDMQRLFR